MFGFVTKLIFFIISGSMAAVENGFSNTVKVCKNVAKKSTSKPPGYKLTRKNGSFDSQGIPSPISNSSDMSMDVPVNSSNKMEHHTATSPMNNMTDTDSKDPEDGCQSGVSVNKNHLAEPLSSSSPTSPGENSTEGCPVSDSNRRSGATGSALNGRLSPGDATSTAKSTDVSNNDKKDTDVQLDGKQPSVQPDDCCSKDSNKRCDTSEVTLDANGDSTSSGKNAYSLAKVKTSFKGMIQKAVSNVNSSDNASVNNVDTLMPTDKGNVFENFRKMTSTNSTSICDNKGKSVYYCQPTILFP